MTKYNVIWIDDEYEQNPYFVSNAVEKGIKIVGYKSAKEGIEALKANFEKWDAIILDANCLLDSIDKSPDVDSLEYSTTNINTLFLMKKEEIPVFILSGYKDFLENNMARKWVKKYEIFHKTDVTDDEDSLNSFYDKIIEKVQNSPRTAAFVRSKYAEILHAYPNWEYILTKILIAYETNDKNNPSVLNLIRDILEFLNIELFNKGLSNSNKSISNISQHWECYEMNFIPGYICAKISSLVNTAHAGSHANSQTLEDVEAGKAPYLVKSCVLDLLTVLHWFNMLDITPKAIEKYITIRDKINNRKPEKLNPNAIRIKGKIFVVGNKYYAEITEGLGISELDNGKNFSGKINNRW